MKGLPPEYWTVPPGHCVYKKRAARRTFLIFVSRQPRQAAYFLYAVLHTALVADFEMGGFPVPKASYPVQVKEFFLTFAAEGSVRVFADDPVHFLKISVQPDDDSLILKKRDISRKGQHAAAGGDNLRLLLNKRFGAVVLQIPKERFAACGKNLRNTASGFADNIFVRIRKRQLQPFGKSFADTAFAACHETAENNAFIDRLPHAVPLSHRMILECSQCSTKLPEGQVIKICNIFVRK